MGAEQSAPEPEPEMVAPAARPRGKTGGFKKTAGIKLQKGGQLDIMGVPQSTKNLFKEADRLQREQVNGRAATDATI